MAWHTMHVDSGLGGEERKLPMDVGLAESSTTRDPHLYYLRHDAAWIRSCGPQPARAFGSHDLYRAKTKLLQPRLRCTVLLPNSTTAVHAQSSPTPRPPPCSIAISDELIMGAMLSRGPLLSDTLPLFSFRRVCVGPIAWRFFFSFFITL